MHHTQSQTTYRQTDHQTSCSSCCLPKDRGRWSAWSLQCWSQCQTVLQFHALLFFWVWLLSNIHGSESLMCQTIYFLLTNFGDLSWSKSCWSFVLTVGEIYHAKFCYKIHCCAASVCSCCIDGGHGQLSPVSQYYNISNVDFTIIFLYPCDPSFLTFWILTLRLLFKTSMRYTTQTLYEMYIRTELDGIPDEIRYGPCMFFLLQVMNTWPLRSEYSIGRLLVKPWYFAISMASGSAWEIRHENRTHSSQNTWQNQQI